MLERFYWLLEIGSMIICLHYLYGEEFRDSIQKNLPTLALVLCDMVICEMIHIYSYEGHLSWLMIPLVIVYTIMEFGRDIKKLIIANSLCIMVIGWLQLLAGLGVTLLRLESLSDTKKAIVIYGFVFISVILLKRCLGRFFQYVLAKNKWIWGIGGFYFIYLILSIAQYKESKNCQMMHFLILVIFGGALCVLACGWQKEKEEVILTQKKNSMDQMYGESYKEVVRQIREKQHDFNNHLQAINGMIYSMKDPRNLADIEEYSRWILDDVEDHKLLLEKWPLLSGYLFKKKQSAEEKNVVAAYSLSVTNKMERIPEYVMIEIIGILMDNAIEAVEGTKKPIVYVMLLERNNTLSVAVANPVKNLQLDEIKEFFKEGVTGKEGHQGLGLHKIAMYAKKYKCDYCYGISKISGTECFWIEIKIKY